MSLTYIFVRENVKLNRKMKGFHKIQFADIPLTFVTVWIELYFLVGSKCVAS